MLYMIFQCGWEPVLIQRILIGFGAILEKNSFFFYLLDLIIHFASKNDILSFDLLYNEIKYNNEMFSISLWLVVRIPAVVLCVTSCVWVVSSWWSIWSMFIRIRMPLVFQVTNNFFSFFKKNHETFHKIISVRFFLLKSSWKCRKTKNIVMHFFLFFFWFLFGIFWENPFQKNKFNYEVETNWI